MSNADGAAVSARREYLTPAQQRLWFLQRLRPDCTGYQWTFAARLEGNLDLPKLSDVFDTLVLRHEILRSAFPIIQGKPVVQVQRTVAPRLAGFDLSSESEQQREDRAAAIVDELTRPFVLSSAAPVRAAIINLGEGCHLWLLVIHKIIADWRSLQILHDQLAQEYNADTTQPSSTTTPLQFAHFSEKQATALESQLPSLLKYWRERLTQSPAQLALPADVWRSEQGWNIDRHEVELDDEMSAQLVSWPQDLAHDPTTMVVTAAFILLLQRLSGQHTVLIGFPVSNRHHEAAPTLIGPVANSLVLDAQVSQGMAFSVLLGNLSQTLENGFLHQDLAFETLVQNLKVEDDQGHPLFTIALEHNPDITFPLEHVTVTPYAAVPEQSPLALQLGVSTTPERRVRLRLTYQRARFSSAKAALLLDQLVLLLRQITELPDMAVDEISLLTSSCRELLPDPTLELTTPSCETVMQQLQRQVDEHPDARALQQGDVFWTYQELWSTSVQLAHALRCEGLRHAEVVAITGTPSFGLIAGITAVLLAGGLVLTIDPKQPLQRQRRMLETASAVIVLQVGRYGSLTDEGIAKWLVDPETARVLRKQPVIGRTTSPANELPEVTTKDAAYLAFTSGSTGTPNAVVCHHLGLSHFVTWQRQTFDIGPDDRVAQLASLGFDVILRETFVTLTSGARLELMTSNTDLVAHRALPWFSQQGVTIVHTVPSVLRMWLESIPEPPPALQLRLLFLVGEPLEDGLVKRWRAAFPACADLINLYGSTETNLAKCWYRVPPEVEDGVQPGGWPLPATQALVLTTTAQLCGRGEPGEIVIRTPCLSRGYLDAAPEDAARFATNPFRLDSEDRIYHTGDRGRYRLDGVLEILGRIDRQVQIRGIRIEPGEVEHVFNQHDTVSACAVTAYTDRQGQQALAAYVIPSDPDNPRLEELRRHLAAWLPRSVIPAPIILLERFPQKLGGKLDYQSLPSPVSEHSPTSLFVTAKTEVEEILAGIWTELLQIPQVGPDDNFFHLGGHSLLATQLASRIRAVLHVELPLRALFEQPVLAQQAKAIQQRYGQGTAHAGSITPAQRTADVTELPLSFAQQRLWFMHQLAPASAAYNLSTAYDLYGELDLKAFDRCVQALIQRHEILRTTFPDYDGQPRQRIVSQLNIKVPVTDIGPLAADRREEEAQRLFALETSRPFNLERGPLLRVMVIRMAATHHILVLTMHHIISDAWSISIVLQELSALYESLSKGDRPHLPALSIQYADFAIWQRQYLSPERLEHELGYWRQQLSNLSPLELPLDHPRPRAQTLRCATHERSLTPRLARSLEELSRRCGTSLFMTLLSAFAVVLHRWSGQTDVVIGAPIANRNLSEIEGLIGFFVNNLVLRCDLTGNPSFVQLLDRVRRVALDAYAHQDVPFDRLVEALAPERDIRHHPLFQVVFSLQNTPHQSLELSGIEARPSSLQLPQVHLDLELHVNFQGKQLQLLTLYNRVLFEPETIERLIEQLETLLEGVVNDPTTSIRSLPLLSQAERNQLLSWAGSTKPFPDTTCLHHLFEKQVALEPDQVALEFAGKTITYQELNWQANRLAQYLRDAGITNENIVGLCLEHSLEQVIGVLAIFKAGGVYLPLDPEYPRDRLKLMIEDSQAQLVLTRRLLRERLLLPSHRVIEVDDLAQLCQNQPDDNLDVGVQSTNLAYVIYTSGSTGRPKGVLIEHKGACNLVTAQIADFGLTAEDRVLQFASPSFDASISEIFMALVAGARLVVAPKESLLPGPPLLQLLQDRSISVVTLSPSILATLEPTPLPALRALIVAGEACTSELITLWAPGRRFFNAYGPTEVTVCASEGECDASRPLPLIGRPLANQEVFILDDNQNLVPIGVPGEIHVGGVGLAREYLNRPELTEEKFVSHPFRTDPSARLYKTGDRGRFRADGTLEFLGRKDQQTKIRGHRIEPGEVETVLQQHPLIDRAVVATRDDLPGGKGLVAYYVISDEVMRSHPMRQSWREEHLQQWHDHFDTFFRGESSGTPAPDTGQHDGDTPDLDEANEVVLTSKIERLTLLQPSRVLEIGCGDGQLAQRMASDSESWVGVDFCQAAQRALQARLARHKLELPQLELRCQPAHDLSGIKPGSSSLAVLDSVIQYFPDVHYLLDVLGATIETVAPGGYVVVCEVPSLPLQELYSVWTELGLSESGTTSQLLKVRVRNRTLAEEELFVDPQLFLGLQHHFPRVARVAVLPCCTAATGGRHRFCYDVVIKLGQDEDEVQTMVWRDWHRAGMNLVKLEQLLTTRRMPSIGFSGVPNSSLALERHLLELLGSDVSLPLAELRTMAQTNAVTLISIDDIIELATSLEYQVTASWSHTHHSGEYDLVFRTSQASTESASSLFAPALEPPSNSLPLATYGNTPLRSRLCEDVEPELRAHLRRHLPEFMIPAAFVMLDTVPLSHQGKVDYRALPGPVRDRSDRVFVEPRTPTEVLLAQIWCEVLDLERVGITESFFDLGGDSILSIQVVSKAKRARISLTPRDMFEHSTISSLASAVSRSMPRTVEHLPPHDAAHTLAPIQHWFFELDLANPDHFNQSMLLEVRTPFAPELLENALALLLSHHETLGLCFTPSEEGWTSAPVQDLSSEIVHVFDLACADVKAQDRAMADAIASGHASLSIRHGPLLCACYFKLGSNRNDRLAIIAHHLCIDGVSWNILLEDLQQAIIAGMHDTSVDLGSTTTPFSRWTQFLAAYASSAEATGELAFWLKGQEHNIVELPQERTDEAPLVSTGRTITLELDEQQTQLVLQQRGDRGRGLVEELLAAALGRVVARWTGSDHLWIDLESHGRIDIVPADLSRTIGWFTALYPALLLIDPHRPPEETLHAVTEQLAETPQRGIGFGILRYLHPDPEIRSQLAALPQRQINLNYLGRVDRATPDAKLFAVETIDVGPTQAEENTRPHLLAINAAVVAGRFTIRWSYSTATHTQDHMQDLAESFVSELLTVSSAAPKISQRARVRPRHRQARDPAQLVVPLRDEGSWPPLFFIHPVGGFVLCYAALAKLLSLEQPVYAIRAWADPSQEPQYEDVPALASRYLASIRSRQPLGPYRIAGWSMGGILAYEMASQLAALGEEVAYLGLIDAAVPGAELPEWLAQRLESNHSKPDQTNDGREVYLSHLGLDPETPELASHVDESFLNDYAVRYLENHARSMTAYRPSPYAGSLVLYKAQQDQDSTDLSAALGWDKLVRGAIEVCSIPGNHLTIMRRPNVRILAHHLRRHLAAVSRR